MSIEQLTKHQIILLAFLVSFVSSIATGIVVVSLMDQAPATVVQTVNRIVERTVEVVAPAASTTASAPVTRETIVVREDQATVEAIEKATRSVVRIFASSGGDARFIGAGVVVSASGRILAVATPAEGALLTATLDDGRRVSLELVSRGTAAGLSIFQIEEGGGSSGSYPAATLGVSSTLKRGQSVAAISGEEELEVATGIVSALDSEGLRTTIPNSSTVGYATAFDSRAFLVNLSGEFVGMKNGQRTALFTPSDILKPYATP